MVALIITELLMALEYSGTQLGWMFRCGSVEWISGLCNDLSMTIVNLVKLLPSFLRVKAGFVQGKPSLLSPPRDSGGLSNLF